jgi:hypothetical protein
MEYISSYKYGLHVYNATLFNQDISGWVVTQVTSFTNFRTGSALINGNTPLRFVNAGE